MKRFFLLLLWLASPSLEAASLVYAGDPLPILLPLGQERRIEIEGTQEIRVGLSRALQEQLHVESIGPHVWLTASATLISQRLYLETDIGSLVLEVRTDAHAPATPLGIAMGPKRPEGASAPFSDEPPGYVALMRHAIQTLYAQDYREAAIPGMRQVPVDERPVALFRCRTTYPSACGNAVESIPHAAWEASPYYVTAVTVRNRLPEPLILDSRDIRGRFAASTFVHPRLGVAGSAQDTTTVVLISHIPFDHAQ